MQIEEGKYYRTANRGKVGPTIATGNDHWPFKVQADGTSKGFVWYKKSDQACYGDMVDHAPDYNLIAEWSEGPVRTERRIVPGVYGRISVTARNVTASTVGIRINANDPDFHWHDFTATELDDLAMVASQLAEALRDV